MKKKSYCNTFPPILGKRNLLHLTLSLVFIFLAHTTTTYANPALKQQKITGTLTDATTNEPLVGATVFIEGTTIGVTTDLNGKYSIEVSANSTLVFSFLGYLTEKVVVKGQSIIDVSLIQDVKSLDELVVIGYGSVKKKDLTGSVVSIKGKEVTMTPTSNVMEALQGKIAGMDINRTSGAVGSGVDILLRGPRSISASNDPLFIIDGLPASYDQINPSDIESIDILKDASSTAIYGSAGCNGVILITTKRGSENKARVTFDAFYGFSGKGYFRHGMTGQEYIDYDIEAYRYNNNGNEPAMTDIYLPEEIEAIDQGKWIDWVDLAIGGVVTQQKYNLSVTGGTEATKIYTSVNVALDKGLLANENQKRYGLRLNLDQKLGKWAKIGTSINVNYTNRNSMTDKIFTRSLSSFPLGDPFDEQGNIKFDYFNSSSISPLGDQIKDQYKNNTKNIYSNGNAYLELTPIKGLSIKAILGATLSGARHGVYYGAQAISNPSTGQLPPTGGIDNNYSFGYMWDNIVTYNKNLGDHSFTLTGITSWSYEENEYNNLINQGQLLDYWGFHNLDAGTTIQKVGSEYLQGQKLSYAGRFIYGFKGKYLITLTNRWDGVSMLAEGHKWESFPSAAVAWRISDENFMKVTSHWINNLKIRFGWGVSGNAGSVRPYQSLTGVATGQRLTIGGNIATSTFYSGIYANPSLTWEKTYNRNLGIDMGLFRNRIELTMEIYNSDTKDLLYLVQLPSTSGATTPGDGGGLKTWQNIATTNNKGFEITLNTRNIETRNFTWTSNISFTKNKNKIVSIPGGDKQGENLFVGSPLGTYYNYKYIGIWSTKDSAEAIQYGAKPGYVKIATNPIELTDSTDDGGVHVYQASDMQKLGTELPKWLLGINNTFTFKGFDLSVFTMIRWGQMIESKYLGWYDLKSANRPSGSDYWTPTNQGAYFPSPGSPNTQKGLESLKYVDGSYIKIKNITVGYTLPKSITKKIHIEDMRVYFTAYNPIIFTKESMLKGTDPENMGSDGFPLYKTYVAGVKLSF